MRVKPKFKAEYDELSMKIEENKLVETDYKKYLNYGISLLKNIDFYYKRAGIENKKELLTTIFPESFTIENNTCRTNRENQLIVLLRGVKADFRQKNSGIIDLKSIYSANVPRAGVEPACQ